MIETYNIEDIKNEITRWATVKTPTLYQHFSTYLGVPTKEVKMLFTGSQAIQDHINQYFQEERIQERIELQEQLVRDLVVLADYLKQIADSGKTVTTTAIVKATGIARCNIKTFAHANPELWEQATAVKPITERIRLKAERKAAIEAVYAENGKRKEEARIAEAERKAEAKLEKEIKRATKRAYQEALAERRSQLKARNLEEQLRRERKFLSKDCEPVENLHAQETSIDAYAPFLSYLICDLAYERGRLAKQLHIHIATEELEKIGYEYHLNLFFNGTNSMGIYIQDIDYLGTFPNKTGPIFHRFSFTWNKRMCEEPKTDRKAPLNLQLVRTANRNGLCFQIPDYFFMSYLHD